MATRILLLTTFISLFLVFLLVEKGYCTTTTVATTRVTVTTHNLGVTNAPGHSSTSGSTKLTGTPATAQNSTAVISKGSVTILVGTITIALLSP